MLNWKRIRSLNKRTNTKWQVTLYIEIGCLETCKNPPLDGKVVDIFQRNLLNLLPFKLIHILSIKIAVSLFSGSTYKTLQYCQFQHFLCKRVIDVKWVPPIKFRLALKWPWKLRLDIHLFDFVHSKVQGKISDQKVVLELVPLWFFFQMNFRCRVWIGLLINIIHVMTEKPSFSKFTMACSQFWSNLFSSFYFSIL